MSTPATMTVGPVTIERPMVIMLDLAPIGAALGDEIGGVLGYDLLSRVVTEIDLEGATVALHDPLKYAEPREWATLYCYERHPCVNAIMEGHEGVFVLDTGSNLPVSVHAPAGREVQDARGPRDA